MMAFDTRPRKHCQGKRMGMQRGQCALQLVNGTFSKEC